jgi:hypothetical protein
VFDFPKEGTISMRLRATVTAALGAAGLLLSLPGSAFAAQGEFIYWHDINGTVEEHVLFDPAGRECHQLDLPSWYTPGHHVVNNTNATAVVYLDQNCAEDVFYVMAPGDRAPGGIKVRSVLFSH